MFCEGKGGYAQGGCAWEGEAYSELCMGRLKPLWFSLFTLTLQTSALLVFIFPAVVFAQDVDTLSSVVNGGRTITDGSTHYRSDFSSISSNWTFNFSWPNSVANAQAFLGIARGTFGALEGGIPASGTNFVANYQAWPAGNSSLVKSLGFPLGSTSLPSGTYTVILAEASGSFNTSGTMNWFATGGSGGSAPSQHSFLTFNYINTERPPEYLDNAIQSVEHGNFTIVDDAEVLRSSLSNENDFWLFNFSWPNAVPNLQAGFYIFRGTFGNVDGGSAVSGNTYASNLQAWPAGNSSILKHMGLPLLTNPNTTPSVYTIMIAERNPLSASLQEEADWFASGGTAGRAPRKYSTLTFELKDQPACCSSVVFLPGFEGSRLFLGENELWPPTLFDVSNDLSALQLDSQGNSLASNITVGGVLEKVYGVSIYDEFIAYMNGLDRVHGNGTIKEWFPLAYDWRYTPQQLLANGIETTEGNVSILETIETVAQNSDTGKVTLVAHSNGGLLGKTIIKALEEQGKDNLIDSFVMVGSPQLGTPQAIGGLLHGEKSQLGNFIFTLVSKAQARALAQNMESAYNLLPSETYFLRVTDPPVIFDETADYAESWRAIWGNAVGNFNELFGFLTDAPNIRDEVEFNDIQSPTALSQSVLSSADEYHNEIDPYLIPSSIHTVQIAGWGLPTIKNITYTKYQPYDFPYFIPTVTSEGDGTVVYASALSSNGEKYFFNLLQYNRNNKKIDHKNILNSSPVLSMIESLIKKAPFSENSFITLNKPQVLEDESRLMVSVHSPVTLGVYDINGNFTGIEPSDQDQGVYFFREEIPNSSYLFFGEGKYIIVPNNVDTLFALKGTGKGPATIKIQELSGETLNNIATFSNVLISTSTQAELKVDLVNGNVVLEIDKNADDVNDYTLTSSEPGEEVEFPQAPLTITAHSQTITLGDPLPEFSYEISGFIANETLETSDLEGEPECSTAATTDSPAGVYTVTCTVGTLNSDYYRFENFIAGQLKIEYQWEGFKQPIDDPISQPGVTPSIFKAGSTVPVKFSLFDADGNIIEATVTPQWLSPTKGMALVGGVDEPVSYESATSGNLFKYDPESKQYIYNWKTKGLASGYWYHVFVRLDDGSIRTVKVGLK